MRVTHVVMGGDVAGGQLVALSLARAARAAGHDVGFISPSAGAFAERVRAEGFPIAVIPLVGALDVPTIARVRRAFRTSRTDLVHTHAHFSVNTVARIAGRLAGAHVVSHMHIENVFRAGPGRRLQIALDNATARLCFAIVAVSESTRLSLLRQGYPAARTTTVYNGIEEHDPVAPVKLADGPTILEVGRLAEIKGQRTLLAALAELDATAVLVGRDLERGGAYESELRAEADRLGVGGRVVFAGHRDDVPALLAGCDVFCLPSLAEGLPLVVLEAMAAGKPVVATAVGGVPELVVPGETGTLVQPGDVDALRRALAEVLADAEHARRLGKNGRERVRTSFTAAAASQRIMSIYEGGR